MYRITVRDNQDRILIEREIDEHPSETYFNELITEVRQDCYVDVCRIGDLEGGIFFEEAVEFELVKGDQYKDLEALE